MKIYTKTGDTGETSLLGNTRHSKDEEIFEVLGTLDELNASLGMVRSAEPEITEIVREIQKDLFLLGALLAGSKKDDEITVQIDTKVTGFEKTIDEMSSKLPELTNFILPGGSYASVKLHFSRSVCRRAERYLVSYFDNHPSDRRELILKYMNRLSDLLFILARYENHQKGRKDILWEGI